MSHPYAAFDGTPLWAAIDAAMFALEANGDLTLTTTDRTHAIGFLCQQLHAAGLASMTASAPRPTAAQLATFLEEAATTWPSDAAWQAQLGVAYADADTEEARRQAGLTQLRHAQGGLSTAQAADYLRAIARRLRARSG